MDAIDWLERRGYVANYPGRWIVLSGQTTVGSDGPTSHKLEFNGSRQEDAMDIIQLMWTNAPDLWTVAIKVPDKLRTQIDTYDTLPRQQNPS